MSKLFRPLPHCLLYGSFLANYERPASSAKKNSKQSDSEGCDNKRVLERRGRPETFIWSCLLSIWKTGRPSELSLLSRTDFEVRWRCWRCIRLMYASGFMFELIFLFSGMSFDFYIFNHSCIASSISCSFSSVPVSWETCSTLIFQLSRAIRLQLHMRTITWKAWSAQTAFCCGKSDELLAQWAHTDETRNMCILSYRRWLSGIITESALKYNWLCCRQTMVGVLSLEITDYFSAKSAKKYNDKFLHHHRHHLFYFLFVCFIYKEVHVKFFVLNNIQNLSDTEVLNSVVLNIPKFQFSDVQFFIGFLRLLKLFVRNERPKNKGHCICNCKIRGKALSIRRLILFKFMVFKMNVFTSLSVVEYQAFRHLVRRDTLAMLW